MAHQRHKEDDLIEVALRTTDGWEALYAALAQPIGDSVARAQSERFDAAAFEEDYRNAKTTVFRRLAALGDAASFADVDALQLGLAEDYLRVGAFA